jgi:hypothetical protein
MSTAFHGLLAALDELHAADSDYVQRLPEGAGQLQAMADATTRVERAYAAWVAGGRQVTAEQRAELLAAIDKIGPSLIAARSVMAKPSQTSSQGEANAITRD